MQELLGVAIPRSDGEEIEVRGQPFRREGRLLRSVALLSDAQAQTSQAFGYKWTQRHSFESDAFMARTRAWLHERYGDPAFSPWWTETSEHRPLLLDAGCGAGLGAMALLGPVLPEIRYTGVDVSVAVDVAARRFAERGLDAAFLQADLARLPFPDRSFQLILSEGVMHHTDSTEGAFHALARLLAPGGRFLFYVYRGKGPIREFTDDYVRDRLQDVEPARAWRAMESLTRLGMALGELDHAEIEIPEDVELLDIPAGRTTIQRLFYWHVAKAFWDPTLTLDELNHINFDWYAPRNAHRQTEEDVRGWCQKAGLSIERERVEAAGIIIVARR